MINLHDNFLTNVEFGQLREQVFFGGIPWYYNENKVHLEDYNINNYQFTHVFYEMNSENRVWTRSDKFALLVPFLSRMEIVGIFRIKANLEPLKVGLDTWHGEDGTVGEVVNGVDRYYSEYHVDFGSCDHMTTGIYYMNTCDGYTEFEDGSKVECRANRYITFPSTLKHRGVSQLDSRFKCVINFNYFTPSK